MRGRGRQGSDNVKKAFRLGTISEQLKAEELPGARKDIPVRALWISLAALAVAAYGAFSQPEFLAGYDALSWLLVLIPAYLLAYYRGWRATTRVLAGGTLFVLVLQLVAELVFGATVNWTFLFWVAVVLLGTGLGIAVVSDLLQRERRVALLLAYSDSLTGLPNRRMLDFMLEKEFAAAQRGRPLSVVLFDIDGLANYNEKQGRHHGDVALQRIAETFDRQMRVMNIGGRFEGDSFLAILSGEKVDGAWVFAERTREAISLTELVTGDTLTASVGVAPHELWMRTPDELIDSVDRAVASAREEGGNRVVTVSVEDREVELPRDLTHLPPEMQAAFEHAWRRQAVEDAEVRYRKLFDGVPVGLYRATPDGEILDANPAMVRMFGYPDRQTLLAADAASLYADPEDRRRWQGLLKEETLVRDFEVRLRRYDGSIIWGRDTARVVFGAGGVVRYYTGVVENITEKKLAEEELQRANEKLRAVIDSAPVAVLALDSAGSVESWNAAAEEIFGWSAEEALGKPPLFVPDDRQDEFRDLLDRVLNGESLVGVELRRRKRDGAQIDCSVYAAPMYDVNGSVTGVMSIMVDVTERRGLETRLARSQRMESVGRLAGGIAHDFNNLLTVILGNCELVLGDMPEGSDQRADIEDVRNAADHAAALTRQLLAFSRRQVLQPKVLNLNSVVTETLDMLGRIIGEDVELSTDLETGLADTKADPVEMGQVVMNLAVNARDAMPAGGRLTLKTENLLLARDEHVHGEEVPQGAYVALTVSDTGTGMDEPTLRRIFEPFFTTKEKGQGTGLGLATVYGIVKQSGGYVTVDSEVGQGTTFRVVLPQLAESAEPEPKREAAPADKGSETVLLVEDEGALRAAMKKGLERRGYTVVEADNAEDALRICEAHEGELDIIVTDLVLPGVDGVEMGRRVKKLLPEVKVLYTSGYTEDALTRDGFTESGDFLHKPYAPSQLARKIRELLG